MLSEQEKQMKFKEERIDDWMIRGSGGIVQMLIQRLQEKRRLNPRSLMGLKQYLKEINDAATDAGYKD